VFMDGISRIHRGSWDGPSLSNLLEKDFKV
jgi:hypothetical protein